MPVLLLFLTALLLRGEASWQTMFDGRSLDGWKETQFTKRGEVSVADGAIVLGAGKPLTGVNWTRPFPKNGYEVRFEGMRASGNDFFASLTFPFGESHATFVTGGWGGDIVGISSIDGWDASDNETRTYFKFENGRWYRFRLRVDGQHIEAWIDDAQVVNVDIGGRAVSMRHGEINLSVPFGFASFGSTGKLRKVEYRELRSPGGDRSSAK